MPFFRNVLCILAFCAPSWGAAERVCDDQFKMVCIETVQTGNSITFYAENRHQLLPVTVNIDLTLQNLQRSQGSAGPFVLDGRERTQVFTLSQQRNAAWSYRYDFTWSRGDIAARHDGAVTYRLPFAPGAAFNVGQSCDGSFSHNGSHRYAVDFDMPEGTAIHAARGGIVVGVKEDSTRGGPSASYQNDGNYVIIQHADRTLGQYFHLRPNGARVTLGDRVTAGTVIGFSGNTGQSTGPHLHFDVIRGAVGVKSETIPVRFETSRGDVTCPERGSSPRALN